VGNGIAVPGIEDEEWFQQHKKDYRGTHPHKSPPPATKSKTFTATRVSQDAHDAIQDLELACMRHGEAKVAECGLTFVEVCARRMALYTYIRDLEARLDIHRTVTLRFD
jgi:hypothetical protein